MAEQDTPKMTHDEMIDTLKGLVFGTFDRTTAKEREALDMAISDLSENKGEWIPVSERLPEDGKYVLFCDIDDDIMIGYHVKGRPVTHFLQDGTYEDMKNVRAWQPLPEPYKAESEVSK